MIHKQHSANVRDSIKDISRHLLSGYGSVGKTHSSGGDNCFPMFVQMQNSASDEGQKTFTFLTNLTFILLVILSKTFALDVSEIAKELLPSKVNGQCFHSKRMAENQKQQLRNYWTLPGLHKAEKTSN